MVFCGYRNLLGNQTQNNFLGPFSMIVNYGVISIAIAKTSWSVKIFVMEIWPGFERMSFCEVDCIKNGKQLKTKKCSWLSGRIRMTLCNIVFFAVILRILLG